GVAPAPAEDVCPGGKLPVGSGKDIVVNKACHVTGPTTGNPQKYQYANINIVKGGTLAFDDAKIEFWAKSILIENGGTVKAGTQSAAIGTKGGAVTIVLYGDEQKPGTNQGDGGQGIICQSKPDAVTGPCGIPLEVWNSNGVNKCVTTRSDNKCVLPGAV